MYYLKNYFIFLAICRADIPYGIIEFVNTNYETGQVMKIRRKIPFNKALYYAVKFGIRFEETEYYNIRSGFKSVRV